MAEAWDGLDQFNMGELSDLADHAERVSAQMVADDIGASREGRPAPRSAERQRLIRLVHVAQRELKLDKETYRAALLSVTGGKKDSCSSMSAEELQLALDHFKRFGFKVRLKPRPAGRSTLRPQARRSVPCGCYCAI